MANKKNEEKLKKLNEKIKKYFEGIKHTKIEYGEIKPGSKFYGTYEDYEDLGYEICGGTTDHYYKLVEHEGVYYLIKTDESWNAKEDFEKAINFSDDSVSEIFNFLIDDEMILWLRD